MTIRPICIGCNRRPDQITEYVNMVRNSAISPDEAVRREEGTYNPDNGHFACSACYFRMGAPSMPWPGWKAP